MTENTQNDESTPDTSTDTSALIVLPDNNDTQQEIASFMHQVCQFDGLLVYGWQLDAMVMAAKLERGGLVRMQRCGGFVIVSAVRPEEGEE